MFLEAMGFTSAGKNYGRDGIKSLVAKYPNIYTHFSLEKEEELEPNKDYQNQLAAMDYVVAVESGVYVHSYDGNMAKGSYRSQKI